jgi:sodium-dependent dicarboxylate transporter 2/3/5
VVGARPAAIVAGLMGATAFVSMWVSNTATAAMMVPIALSWWGLPPLLAALRFA